MEARSFASFRDTAMSRLTKSPIKIPDGVDVVIDGRRVSVKGSKGSLDHQIHETVEVVRENGTLMCVSADSSTNADAMIGTTRALVNNMVIGVCEGFQRRLQLVGVGYRAQVQGRSLVLQLGFSYEVNFPIPDGIDIKCPDQTHITVFGANKQQVGQTAAEIRKFRPPEPYKGKGVKYEDEYILRKEGKKK